MPFKGTRLTAEFINSLLWFASVRHLAQHSASTIVMDTRINTTVSYNAPITKATADDLLGIEIRHGLIHATCQDIRYIGGIANTIVKVEFENLACNGRATLTKVTNNLLHTFNV
jgi:hypothetical protein